MCDVTTFYDVHDLCDLLHLGPLTVRHLIRNGELAAHLVGRCYMVREDALDAYLKKQKGKMSKAGRPARKTRKCVQKF